MTVSLLALPYDVRHAIYQQLFPPHDQIYIQAFGDRLRFISPGDGLALQLSLVCKDLSAEARAYLYNSYLFNIVGTKNDCMKAYKSFEAILRRHARHAVRINAFSNGQHSATMCISMQSGDVKMGVLNRRRRGEAKTIREMELEQNLQAGKPYPAILDSINAGLNPVNGLPVPTSKASNTGSSPAAAINAGLNPVNGLPVPPVENSKGASKSMTPSSVQPSSSKTSSSAGLTISPLTFTTIDGTVSLRPYTSTSTRTVEPGPKSGAASPNPSPSKVSTHAPQLTALHTIPSSKKPKPTAQNPTTSSNTPSAIPKPTTTAPSSSSQVPESTSTSSKSSTETKTSTEMPKSSLDSSPFNTSTASKEPAPSSTSKDEGSLFPSESATRGNSDGLIGM
ncbi:hypothetical protein KC316_g4131 [Hortaea werneckii]|nr:hypothetical protein KC324_g4501 [Hortaea werneckii]KAI7589090.1 hypothetical protein KC316_g4131 [Hortaea werneckii]